MRRFCVMSAIAGSQLIWYKSMCTQRRTPQQGGDSVAASDGSAGVQSGPAVDGGPATVDGDPDTDPASVRGGPEVVDSGAVAIDGGYVAIVSAVTP